MKKRKLLSFCLVLLVVLITIIFFFHRLKIKDFLTLPSKNPSLIILHEKSLKGLAGERTPLTLTLLNRTKFSWSSRGKNPIYLSYHLLDKNQRVIQFENERFPLPVKVRPGKQINLTINLRHPLEAGHYLVEFDLVKEGAFWFKDKGYSSPKLELTVLPLLWPENKQTWSLKKGSWSKIEFSSREFSLLLKMIRLTLEKNKVTFHLGPKNVYGFRAGLDYHQIWLRDSTTLIPVIKYYFPRGYLFSWLEAFLESQAENGSLPDWLDSQGHLGKNTTESDQEASAVQAAFLLSQLTSQDWLLQDIKGHSLINRLEKALTYLLRHRWSPRFSLIRGAHTVDWGDVDLVDADQQAIQIDERTHWTVDIYDQAMFYLACRNLSTLFQQLNHHHQSLFWAQKAAGIKRAVQKWLWDHQRGYFLIHRHCDSLQHSFEEKDILAVGGNTMAILAGLASPPQVHSIIQAIISRKKQAQLPTFSATLLPPYPPGTFKHPLLDEPYEYQNGGQWDWWGGRFILALFEHGYSSLAKQALSEIIALVQKNRGLFEWSNRVGIAQGSDYFAGSAGALGQALIEGYCGLNFARDSLNLSPRLQKDEVRLHLYLPALDAFVAYHYQYQEPGRIIFTYNSNLSLPGKINLLLPEEMTHSPLKVKLDGQAVPFQVKILHQDAYLCLESDYYPHTLEISIDK